MTKHNFSSILAGLVLMAGFASIASAEDRGAPDILPIGSQSKIGDRKSAISIRVPFIRNQGQIADSRVLFYARTFGGTVYVTTGGELVYALPRSAGGAKRTTDDGRQTADRRRGTADDGQQTTTSPRRGASGHLAADVADDILQSEIGNLPAVLPAQPMQAGRQSKTPQTAVIREVLVNADIVAPPSGAERSEASINSFIGSDPRRRQSNIPSFNRVRFGEVYEGISLDVRAAGDNVEKIFTVAPGADPARIALRLEGVEGVRITPEGELEARTALGPVRFTAPVAYQFGADGERRDVSVAYALEGGLVGFSVGAFDASRALVIDPLLASTFIGGTDSDVIRAMAQDSQGNVYVAGCTASVDFPTNNCSDYKGAPPDGFIAKFDPQLFKLLAATYLGGAGEDAITALAVNTNNGAVYAAGYTDSQDFHLQAPLYGVYGGGTYDGFVAMFDGSLAALSAATYLGGVDEDKVGALAVSPVTADIFVSGLTASTNFPVTAYAFQTALAGLPAITGDVFIIRFNSALGANMAATYLGGAGADGARGLAVGADNYVYLAGDTASADFPIVNGAIGSYCGGARDAFVARLPAALYSLAASTFLGGAAEDCANALALASFSNIVCVAGYTDSANFPSTNGSQTSNAGLKDAFLTLLDRNLVNIPFSTYLGGADDDEATAVAPAGAPGATGLVYVAGHTLSLDFPVAPNAYSATHNGGRDAFLACFATGCTLRAATYLGGTGDDAAYAMALTDNDTALIAAGSTASSNFPFTTLAYNNDRHGRTDEDGFVTKMNVGLAYGTVKWKQTLLDPGDGYAFPISPVMGWDGSIYVGVGSNLYAYDSDGNERWRFQARGRLHDIGGVYWGLGSVPAIGLDGTIYFGTQNGYFHAVRDDGTHATGLWTNFYSGQRMYSSPAIGNDGTIYFGSTEYPFPFYAVRSNGTDVWPKNLTSSILGSPAIGSNGLIYVANSAPDPRLYAIRTNGVTERNWAMPAFISSSPLISSNGWVYIGSGTKLYGFALDGSATQTWDAAGPIYSSPVMDEDGIIYVGGGSNLYAFRTNASTRVWHTGGAIKSSPAIGQDGTIYVGASDTNLYAFNKDGSTNWVFPTDDEINFQSPLVARDGTVYFTDLSTIYALDGQARMPESSWPTYKHDVLRTGNAAFDAANILRPTGLAASNHTDRVALEWNANPNAEYYQVFRDTSYTETPGLVSTLQTNAFDDTSAEPGLPYFYWVKVTTPIAESDYSAYVKGGIPPSPPTNVVASKGDPYTNVVVITWEPSDHANMYYVYRGTNNNPAQSEYMLQLNQTRYTNTLDDFFLPIVRGQIYYYWVKAGATDIGFSDYSEGDGTNNAGGTPPLPPAELAATTHLYETVDVSWSFSTGATSYVVYRNTSNDVASSVIITNIIGGLGFSDSNTVALQAYYYWVRATNMCGMGEFTTNDAMGMRNMRPPQWVQATNSAALNQVRVTWGIELEPTSYIIYRGTSSNSEEAVPLFEVPYPAATNYDDADIERGIGYYYWVMSKNEASTSALSTAFGFGGTPPLAPLDVAASDGTDADQVLVTWSGAAHSDGYELYRRENYTWSPDSLVASVPSGTDNYWDSPPIPGRIYYYWLKSTNQFGRGELSGFNTGWRKLMAPYALAASDGVSTGYVRVTWSSANSNATYELWRGASSDFGAALVLANAVSATVYYDSGATPGAMFYYWVRAKTDQFVSEFSASDRGWRALGTVDIGVTDLVFLPARTAAGGIPEAVSFRVTNHGAHNMVAPNTMVACDFYISSNGVNRIKMGAVALDIPLAANDSAVVVLPEALRAAIVTPALPPGGYYVYVSIRHVLPSTWLDPNLNNNTVARNGGALQVSASQSAGSLLLNDYNGDGYTDLAMYEESAGLWKIWYMGPGGVLAEIAIQAGGPGFMAVPADYDGDGKCDPAVYQAATGTWIIWMSAFDYARVGSIGWGGPDFNPVWGDFDGDGRADPAVYREATGTWHVWLSGSGYSMATGHGMGGTGFKPALGDFDGDRRTDPAVYREATGSWRVWLSGSGYAMASGEGMGGAGYGPVLGDYDGDGRADPAVFQASQGSWLVWLSASGYARASAWGLGNAGAVAVPGDFDGDGLNDLSVYWESFGLWRLWRSGWGYGQLDILAWPGEAYQPVWQ